jgi:hypothetical protein
MGTPASRARVTPSLGSGRLVAALLLTGLVLRILALPLPGTGDVAIWKTWGYNAVLSGETVLYGVGGHPPQRRELTYLGGDLHFAIDYPPLAVYALGLAGRLYHAFSPEMPDTAAFTAIVKLPGLAAEIGLAWVVFAAVRRLVGAERSRLAMLACWLNPALLSSGSVLGYLDPLFLLPAVAAVVAAAAGQTWLTGALFAAAVLTKAQGVLLVPIVALAVVGTTRTTAGRYAERVALRLGETAAGAALTTVVVVSPFAVAGTLPNLAAGLRSLGEHDMLSGNAANAWWIVTWLIRGFDALPDVGAWQAFTALPRILAISVVSDLGFPNPRAMGLLVTGAAWLWALWRARRARDLWLLAGVGAFLVHAYFVLAAQVHENHLLLAIPLAVLAAVGRPSWARVAVVLTAIQALNLNLFYGFSEGIAPNLAIPRSVTVIDAVVVLSVVNVAALIWHARVLLAQTGLSPRPARAETSTQRAAPAGWRAAAPRAKLEEAPWRAQHGPCAASPSWRPRR